jgi:hypothetical protein
MEIKYLNAYRNFISTNVPIPPKVPQIQTRTNSCCRREGLKIKRMEQIGLVKNSKYAEIVSLS